MNIKELEDALNVTVDSGVPLSSPVFVQAADNTLDEIQDVVSDQSSVTILLKD